ncbi:MAG: LPXTG cell wall anchor domain-containing protein, partial [Lachnospiraceae bacterium]|nr:LPXTG cell wall anchor domain-containing protein [Lachnospiraceae bacterium]
TGSTSRTRKSKASSPRTGDESHVMVWIGLAVICAAGLAALLRFRRRSR